MQKEPERYKEGNNKSYKDERAWANERIETKIEELWCVNPLTVANNAKGKQKLCIDLSRCLNKVIKAPKEKRAAVRGARGGFSYSYRRTYSTRGGRGWKFHPYSSRERDWNEHLIANCKQ